MLTGMIATALNSPAGIRRSPRVVAALGVAVAAAIALVLLLALAPSQASSAPRAPRLALETGTPAPRDYQRLMAEARVPTPSGEIVLALRGCPGAESRSCVPWEKAMIYLAPGQENARYFYHELGHIFDRTMPQRVRDDFLRITQGDGPWLTDGNSPLEQFAEAYSLCAINNARPLHHGIVGYDYRPTVHQHRRTCRLIRSAGSQ